MALFDTTSSACFIDDLLSFNIDEADALVTNANCNALLPPSSADVFTSPECEDEEEELEWLSNKDAFPSVDTLFVDMMLLESSSSATELKHESPVSVLENSNISFESNNSNYSNAVITSCCSGHGLAPPTRRPRSKGSLKRIRGGFVNVTSQQWFVLSKIKANKPLETSDSVSSRKCKHCESEKTPQWRAGPDGPKTLCNACGVRYKSGRLCPEYRPANSPTFSSAVHSSSHRKIIEMRKMKQIRNTAVKASDKY